MTGSAVRSVGVHGVPFHYVVEGIVDVRRRGAGRVELRTGDLVMLPRGGAATLHATTEVTLLGGVFDVEGPAARPGRTVPPIVHVCGFHEREPGLASLVHLMCREASRTAGVGSVLERLGDALASAALRAWLESGCGSARDWISSFGDPHLGRALDAIHDDPGSPWTVAVLARLARSSRSEFTERFRDAVGETPARYVARVRMEQAERLLRAGSPVGDVASRVGYTSEAGFSRAFRRHAGSAPSTWRRVRSGAAELGLTWRAGLR